MQKMIFTRVVYCFYMTCYGRIVAKWTGVRIYNPGKFLIFFVCGLLHSVAFWRRAASQPTGAKMAATYSTIGTLGLYVVH